MVCSLNSTSHVSSRQVEDHTSGEYTETCFLLSELRDVGKQVRDLNSPRQLPLPAAHGLVLPKRHPEAVHLPIIQIEATRSSSRFTVSKPFIKQSETPEKPPLVRLVCIMNLYLSPRSLAFTWVPVTPRSLKRSTPGKDSWCALYTDTLGT